MGVGGNASVGVATHWLLILVKFARIFRASTVFVGSAFREAAPHRTTVRVTIDVFGRSMEESPP